MTVGTNPYEPPHDSPELRPKVRDREEKTRTSVFMIAVGAFYFFASFYILFAHGMDALVSSYRSVGRFAFGFMFFYGLAGGLTSVFHFAHLIGGWPRQALAGMYAIGIAIVLALIAVVAMEMICRQ